MPGIGLRRKTQNNGAERIRPFLLRIVAQCQEKPIDEAFPVLAAHAAMVVDVAFEVCEDTLEFVVGVGHPLDLLPGEQIWQIKANAGHGRAQPSVRVEGLARLGADGALFQERAPLLCPRLEGLREAFSVTGGQRSHQRLQFYAGGQTRIACEFPPDDGAHVILAHLHLVPAEEREQRLHPVDDDTVNHIAVMFDPRQRIRVVRGALVGDVLQVQRPSARCLKGDQHAAVAPEVGRVKLHHSMAAAHRVVPGNLNIAQKTLHS